jgi:excisionase family DNA binding protein
MEKLLTLYELADYLKLDKFTIYRMVYRRQLPAIKVANQWRFKEKDIEKWLEKSKKYQFKRKKRKK